MHAGGVSQMRSCSTSAAAFGPAGISVPPAARRRRLACTPSSANPTQTAPSRETLFGNLEVAYTDYRRAPPSMKFGFTAGIQECMNDLKAAGMTPKWGAVSESLARRNTFQGELRQVGIKNPDKIAVPSVRNDLAFLVSVTLSTSLVAVVAGAVLPGDWGFFTSYLVGGITLGVLAVGSTAPGLLQFAIDKFSQVFPDYRERVVRHEAGHFLLGYLVGVPVTDYSLAIGQEHTEFAEAKIQKRLIERTLEDNEIDQLAVVAVAGIAAEGLQYEEVMGQNADLFDLQRILLRSKTRLSDSQQQNITRWAVLSAASALKQLSPNSHLPRPCVKRSAPSYPEEPYQSNPTTATLIPYPLQYKKEHDAVIDAMRRGASVVDCVRAIEVI